MGKVSKLAWGIVTKPVPTFKRIKEEKPFADGLLVFFFTYSLLILSSFIFEPEPILEEFDFFIKFHPLWQALIVTAGLLILSFLALVLGIGIINLIARLFKGKGAFKSLLNCALLISAVHLIVFPLYVLITALNLETADSIIFIAVSLWASILLIAAIKTIYNFSLLRTISTYLCYLLTIILILAVPLGIIGLTYFRFTKSADKLLADIEYDRKTQGALEYFALDDKYKDLKDSFLKKDVVYDKEEYKKALADHSKFVEKYPDSNWAVDVRSDIGEIYWEGLKDSEKAIEEYQGIIRDYPDNWRAVAAQYDIATIYEDLKDYDRAITAYQKVITDYPESNYAPMAQDNIGDIYEDNFKDYQQAIKEYRKVVENYPRSYEADYAQYTIGSLYRWRLKNYDQAIKEYRKLIKNYPNSIWASLAQMDIGDTHYRNLNQKEQAIKAYQQVIKHYPKSDQAKEAQDQINNLKAEAKQIK
jgi:TolA-binding protein